MNLKLLALIVIWCVFLSIVLAIKIIRRCTQRKERLLRGRYCTIISRWLLMGGETTPCLPLIGSQRARMVLVGQLALISTATYGYPSQMILRIVAKYDLDVLLLTRAKMSWGWHRVRAMQLLSQIPLRDSVSQRVTQLKKSKNQYISLYALLAEINHSPERCILALESYPRPLADGELYEVAALLKRGIIPVACEPLLNSSNLNVKMLGVTMIRHFGVIEAEGALLKQIAQPNDRVRTAALKTLCSLHLPLSPPEIRSAMGSIDSCDRRILYRHAARLGYSIRSVDRLIYNSNEWEEVERLIRSHKHPCFNPYSHLYILFLFFDFIYIFLKIIL